jgi:hypothetical protein
MHRPRRWHGRAREAGAGQEGRPAGHEAERNAEEPEPPTAPRRRTTTTYNRAASDLPRHRDLGQRRKRGAVQTVEWRRGGAGIVAGGSRPVGTTGGRGLAIREVILGDR